MCESCVSEGLIRAAIRAERMQECVGNEWTNLDTSLAIIGVLVALMMCKGFLANSGGNGGDAAG